MAGLLIFIFSKFSDTSFTDDRRNSSANSAPIQPKFLALIRTERARMENPSSRTNPLDSCAPFSESFSMVAPTGIEPVSRP